MYNWLRLVIPFHYMRLSCDLLSYKVGDFYYIYVHVIEFYWNLFLSCSPQINAVQSIIVSDIIFFWIFVVLWIASTCIMYEFCFMWVQIYKWKRNIIWNIHYFLGIFNQTYFLISLQFLLSIYCVHSILKCYITYTDRVCWFIMRSNLQI